MTGRNGTIPRDGTGRDGAPKTCSRASLLCTNSVHLPDGFRRNTTLRKIIQPLLIYCSFVSYKLLLWSIVGCYVIWDIMATPKAITLLRIFHIAISCWYSIWNSFVSKYKSPKVRGVNSGPQECSVVFVMGNLLWIHFIMNEGVPLDKNCFQNPH